MDDAALLPLLLTLALGCRSPTRQALDAGIAGATADADASADVVAEASADVSVDASAEASDDGSFACGSKRCSRGEWCDLVRTSFAPPAFSARCSRLDSKCQAADDPCACERARGLWLDCESGHPMRRLTIPMDP